MSKFQYHDNWNVALPMLVSDLVYWLSDDENLKDLKITPQFKQVVRDRLKNIVANVGKEDLKELCAKDGIYLDDEFFESLK